MKIAVVAFMLAGCAGSASFDGGGHGAVPCTIGLTFDPATPVAGPSTTIRVSPSLTNVPGVPSYSWRVSLDGAAVEPAFAQADHSEIDVRAALPGIYVVSLDVTGSSSSCTSGAVSINVRAPGARSALLRLRALPPPATGAPPLEKVLTIYGGANADLGAIGVDRGISVNPQVQGPDGGTPAYLRFAPLGAPGAVVEAFADAAGHAQARLVPAPHAVLVVPSLAGAAPRRIASWSPSSPTLALDAGSTITGTVRDPAGAPLSGAKVQLSIDGVPSTLATTAGDGSFTVHAVTVGQAAVTVEVTPPSASGLPRLSATSQGLDLGVPLQIHYAADLARKDLAGTRVQRLGAPLANATLTVVGSLAAAGTVTAGTSTGATGDVRISTRADAAGVLPSTLVPSAALAAVIVVAAGDFAVAALDTTTSVPPSLEAPPMQPIATAALDASGTGLPGAVVELVPAGALAMAAAPALHRTADDAGMIVATLASGGHYDLRFHDPWGRAAPLVIADRVAQAITATYRLPPALQLHGRLVLDGTQALANAAVQILCETCTGIDREKPIAEAASGPAGEFRLAVPDPGTM